MATTRRIDFLGRPFANERVIWFDPNEQVALTLDAEPVRLEDVDPVPVVVSTPSPTPPISLRRRLYRARKKLLRMRDPRHREQLRRERADQAIIASATSGPGHRQFAEAWLLLDRDTAAGDNAEHLYRWLRAQHPEVNAWFVLNRDSRDWDRLAAEGFRLLEHRSDLHTIAMLNTRHLISSQVDGYVVSPLDTRRFGEPGWKFTFLQHGVIKDDLSSWLNTKPIDLMLTSTAAEYDSIAGPGTRYRYSPLEMALTGLPRHDRLLRLGRAVPAEQRRALLFMPTWRTHLVGDRSVTGAGRKLVDGFWDSEFARCWRAVLEADRLRKAADAHGLTISMVLHPNMDAYLKVNPLPPEISLRRFADVDIQQLLADSVGLVTDFSSLAFDAAYIDRPVVYYQFDADAFAAGHIYTPGYWDYPQHGFGPVCPDAESALDAIVAMIESGGTPQFPYAQRIAETFAFRDGNCCERAYRRIKAMESPPPRAQLHLM
jgi:hypothetical protein